MDSQHHHPPISRRTMLRGLAMLGGAAVVAACGAPPAGAPAESGAAPSGSGAKILLRLNGIDPPGQEFADKFIADYNAENNVNIEIDYTDWASSFQKATTGLAGGTAPDIFMGGGLWTPVIASKGGALVLDDYVATWDDWEDWYEGARKDVTYNGHISAVPYRMNARGNIIYRKSMFEEAGLDPEKPPATWEEAHEMASQLTKKDGDKYDMAGWLIVMNPPDLTQQYEDALFQAGGHYFNEDRTQPLNNTPEGEEALQFWVSFVQDGVLPAEGMDSGIPNLNAYSAGKIALFPGWPQDMLNTKLNAPEIWDDTLVGPPLTHKEQAYQIYVDKYFIYSGTKVPDEAAALVRALVSGDAATAIGIEGVWGLPCRKLQESAKLYEDPRMQVFLGNIQYGKPREIVPQHFDVQPAMGREVEAAVRGAKTVQQALADMDDVVTKILQGG
ncbi:MAG: sugar ABC transporter substrate-binding protein [Caldilineaceae bacterium]